MDVPAYLRALWALCEARGAEVGVGSVEWRSVEVGSLEALQSAASRGEGSEGGDAYDAIVVAAGARTISIAELRDVPLKPCRGQNLLLENTAGLMTPLISGKYVVPVGTERSTLLAGATFEYDSFEEAHRPADAPHAERMLRPALALMHPALARARLLGCQAGVRALPPRSHLGYVPLACRLPRRVESASGGVPRGVWLMGGLGSRGLIHHALVGGAVAEAVRTGDEGRLPEHTRRWVMRAT